MYYFSKIKKHYIIKFSKLKSFYIIFSSVQKAIMAAKNTNSFGKGYEKVKFNIFLEKR